MTEQAKLELGVLAGAVMLGVLGDGLLRALPWGINIVLWMGALLAALITLAFWKRDALAGTGRWLLIPLTLFSLSFLWRDSPALKLLSLLALIVTLALILLWAQGGSLRAAGLVDYAAGGMIAGLNAACGLALLLFGRAEWKNSLADVRSKRVTAVIRGLLLAIPLLALFGSLFVLADAVFEGLVRSVLHLNFARLLTHLLVGGICAWGAGGYLRGVFLGRERQLMRETRLSSSLSLGIIEISMVLGLLDVLFLTFVLVQFRYFFAGTSQIQATTGLTYAEYARRGFFELIAASALVLPLLLGAHWLFVRRKNGSEGIFRILAGIQIVLVFVIMASAFARMRLYQAEYGLTQQRLYPTAFMAWLAVVFVWFAATVLIGHRERFAFGALLAGYLLIASLQILSPDALIARVNIERGKLGRTFDARYAASLSADALPELVAGLPSLTPEDRCVLRNRLAKRWSSHEQEDWRTWNWSRAKGRRLMLETRAMLDGIHCAEQPE
jgi:hypothetical protein